MNRSHHTPLHHDQLDSSGFSYKNEIIQSFQVFDYERSGSISVNDLKLILRAFGFRVTKHDVLRDVLESNRRRGIIANHGDNRNKNDSDFSNLDSMIKNIDLETVLDIILLAPQSKYNRQNQSQEDFAQMLKINFQLFDVDNKGYITENDIRNVIQDIKSSKQSGMEGFHGQYAFHNLDDSEIRAMIDEFDGDQHGMIDQQEFKRIMQNEYYYK